MAQVTLAPKKAPPKWLLAAKLANQAKTDWLSRALGRAGVMRLQDAESAIRSGRVSVNGKKVHEPLSPVTAQSQVKVDGRAVDLMATTQVLMFHKPKGVVVAGSDSRNQGTVFQRLDIWLPKHLFNFNWHGVGRLDRNTTGLFLFTNDEKLLQHLTLPASHLPKTYLAKVSSQVSSKKLEPLRQGISLDDGFCRPAQAEMVSEHEVSLTLTEGRNHQVKRMLAAVGLPVLELHRTQVGNLALDIPLGEFRVLTPRELNEKLSFTLS